MKGKALYIVLGLIVVFGGLFAWYYLQPGRLDAFAQCLTDRKVTFYGAFWCPHCQAQKQLFGKSASKLPYVECSTPDGQRQTQQCADLGIKSYPTWEFENGERQSGEMTIEQLSERSGCPLPA